MVHNSRRAVLLSTMCIFALSSAFGPVVAQGDLPVVVPSAPAPKVDTPKAPVVQQLNLTPLQNQVQIPTNLNQQPFGTVVPLDVNRQTDSPHLSQPKGTGLSVQSSVQPSITNKELIGTAADQAKLFDKINNESKMLLVQFQNAQDLKEKQRFLSLFLELLKYAVEAGVPELATDSDFVRAFGLLSKVGPPELQLQLMKLLVLQVNVYTGLKTAQAEQSIAALKQEKDQLSLAAQKLFQVASQDKNVQVASSGQPATGSAAEMIAALNNVAAQLQGAQGGTKPGGSTGSTTNSAAIGSLANSISSTVSAITMAAGNASGSGAGNSSSGGGGGTASAISTAATTTTTTTATTTITTRVPAKVPGPIVIVPASSATSTSTTSTSTSSTLATSRFNDLGTFSLSALTDKVSSTSLSSSATSALKQLGANLESFKTSANKLGTANAALKAAEKQYDDLSSQISQVLKFPGGKVLAAPLLAQKTVLQSRVATLRTEQASAQTEFLASFASMTNATEANKVGQSINKSMTANQLVSAALTVSPGIAMLSGSSEMTQLQALMNKHQASFDMLTNIMSTMHSTMSSIVQNMR